ncbi:MAG: hypothetical protein OEZ34_00335 [Spirochaetia bacterium]|nr:hypothetical protein [Spirochaetia bacterium]
MDEKKHELIANQIYDNINLLTIRKSVKMICDLSKEDLDEFVQFHSPILIFLLNILDKTLSTQLLSNLSEESLLYLMAEEFRTILITQMATVSGDLDELVDISNYMEVCEKKGLKDEISESTKRVIEILWKNRVAQEKSHFLYLDSLNVERRKELYMELKDYNIHIAIGLMIFSPDNILMSILDDLVVARPEILKHIPEELINIRFKLNYDLYLSEEIFNNLPEQNQNSIRGIHELIFDKFQKEFQTIKLLRQSEYSEGEIRQKVLNIVFSILERVRPDMRETMLSELSARGTINDDDITMLKTIRELL